VLECFEFKTNNTDTTTDRVSLTFEQRQKSRGQAVTDSGKKIGWFIERGYVLSDGDSLVASDGQQFAVVAAPETLSEVITDDHLLLTRAAYHLGNRHVPLQINHHSLCYQHDHVLDDMVAGLGLTVTCVTKPFHSESGAYHSHGTHSHGTHSHNGGGHNHAHDHHHPHDH